MKKLSQLLVFSLWAILVYSQSFTSIPFNCPAFVASSTAWGDYDNDGDLDMLTQGMDLADWMDKTQAYRNDGNGNFTLLNLVLPGFFNGTCNWADYDSDGDLDIIISGSPVDTYLPHNVIFRNDGNDVFVDINLQGTSSSKSHCVDIDNDGDIDIAVISGGVNFLLNDGNGNFEYYFSGIYIPAQRFVFPDVDSDGDADVFVFMQTDYSVNTKLFINNGNLTFTESTSSFVQMKSSSSAWGDLDDDGDLDLVMTGDAETSAGGVQTIVYENTGGDFLQIADTFPDLNFGATQMADFDNDGDLDIAIMGAVTFNTDSGYVYINNGSFSFTRLPQFFNWGHSTGLSITDYDNDNDIDILLVGSYYGGSPSELYRNEINTINYVPNPPTNISSTIQGDRLILNWNPGSDPETDTSGLSYNVEIYQLSTGKYIVVPMSDSLTGRRMVPDRGNAQSALSKIYDMNKFEVGPCQIRIQSIDHGYEGSAFSSPVSVIIPPTSSFITDHDNVPVNDTLHVTYIGNCEDTATFSWDFDSATVISGSGVGPYQITWTNEGTKTISLEVSQNGTNSTVTTMQISVGHAFVHVLSPIQPLSYSRFAWADYDNDDDLDIIYGGKTDQNTKTVNLWRNDGNDQFTMVSASFMPLTIATLNWGDYDQDGLLDILISGTDTTNTRNTIIYKNEGNDIFTELTTNILPPAYYYSDWADIDNDGDLDIITGSVNAGKVYKNIGGGNFEIQGSIIGLKNEPYWFDFNNDGYIDILSIRGLLRNNGDYSFSLINCGFPWVVEWVNWGDFNNDGWLDMFASGYDEDYHTVTYFYVNDKNGGFNILPFANLYGSMPNFDFGDYDNDGDLDMLFCGTNAPVFDMYDRIYENIGNFQFIEKNIVFPFSISNESRWVDYDNDGDLDISTAARSGDNNYYSNIFKNEITLPNQRPEPPTDLNTDLVSGHIMELSWDMATDLETNDTTLTYNLYLYKVGGDTIISSLANINTGFKKTVGYGNMGFNRQLTFTATEIGEYRWSVQAVDNNFEGSAFATEQSIVVTSTGEIYESGAVQLFQNTPNPFSATTNIGYYLPQSEFIELDLYDQQGKRIQVVAVGMFGKGNHSIELKLEDLGIGTFFYSLKTANGIISRKMVVVE